MPFPGSFSSGLGAGLLLSCSLSVVCALSISLQPGFMGSTNSWLLFWRISSRCLKLASCWMSKSINPVLQPSWECGGGKPRDSSISSSCLQGGTTAQMVLVIFHSSHIKHEQSVSLQNIQLLLNYMPIVKKKKRKLENSQTWSNRGGNNTSRQPLIMFGHIFF